MFKKILLVLFCIILIVIAIFTILRITRNLIKDHEKEDFCKGNLIIKYRIVTLAFGFFWLFFLFFLLEGIFFYLFTLIVDHVVPGHMNKHPGFLGLIFLMTYFVTTMLISWIVSINIFAIIFGRIYKLTKKQVLIIFTLNKYPKEWIKEFKP